MPAMYWSLNQELLQGIQEGRGDAFSPERTISIWYDVGFHLGFMQKQIEAIQQRVYPPKIETERPEDV